MRALILVFTGLIISLLCMCSQENRPQVSLNANRVAFAITPDTVIGTSEEQFSSEIVEMFHVIFPPEPGRIYTEPDSSNTRIFYLDQFGRPGIEQTVLIETWAGTPGGSCGLSIRAGTYFPDQLRWEILVEECGGVDTVYSLHHNDLSDFTVSDKWGGNKVRYQYNGEAYVGVKDPTPISDTDLIAVLIHREMKDYDYSYVRNYLMPQMEWNYVNLDSSANPYLLLECGLDGAFIVHEDQPHEFSLVNFLEDDVEVNILRTHHNGMPDIHTFNLNYIYNIYRWNGEKYVLHHTEEWVCPR